jgi:hypothetical protein
MLDVFEQSMAELQSQHPAVCIYRKQKGWWIILTHQEYHLIWNTAWSMPILYLFPAGATASRIVTQYTMFKITWTVHPRLGTDCLFVHPCDYVQKTWAYVDLLRYLETIGPSLMFHL